MLQTLYTECMLHTTAYRFPGILRWFEVIETDVVGLHYNFVSSLLEMEHLKHASLRHVSAHSMHYISHCFMHGYGMVL